MHVSDAVITVAAAVLGGIAGPLLQKALPDKSGMTMTVGRDNYGPMVQSKDTIKIDVSQTIISQVTEQRKEKKPKGESYNKSSTRRSDGNLMILWGIFAVAVGAVVGYLKYQREIIFGLQVAGAFSIAFLLSALLWLRLKRVRLRGSLSVQYVGLIALSLVVFLDIHYVHQPPFFHGKGSYRQLVTLGRTEGLGVFGRPEFGAEGFGFVAYQVFGLALAAVLLGLVIYRAFVLLAAANAAIGAPPIKLWRRVSAAAQYGTAILLFLCFIAALSTGMTSGAVYQLLPKRVQVEAPATSPTPTPKVVPRPTLTPVRPGTPKRTPTPSPTHT